MGKDIKEKEYGKYLGVLIEKTLSWTYHINYANLKISRGKAILTKLRHYVSKDTLRMLYFVFVQPNIDYGLIFWESATSPSSLKYKLKKHLGKFYLRSQTTRQNSYNLKLLKIGIFMWKVLKVPKTLKDIFSIREKNYGTIYQQINFELWNSLPTNIKNKK